MSDDLVVREDDARVYAEMAKTWTVTGGGEEDEVTRIGNLARAYLAVVEQLSGMTLQRNELDRSYNIILAQLAAMTAERDGARTERDTCRAASKATRELRAIAEDKLAASEAARGRLETRVRSAVAWINLHGAVQDEWVDTAVRLLEPALAEPTKEPEAEARNFKEEYFEEKLRREGR